MKMNIYLWSSTIMIMVIVPIYFCIIFPVPCLVPNFGGQAEPSFQNKEEKEDIGKSKVCHAYPMIMIEMN